MSNITSQRRQQLHPEQYISAVIRYYMEAMIYIREIDRLGNISEDAQDEIRRINSHGKLTGYSC